MYPDAYDTLICLIMLTLGVLLMPLVYVNLASSVEYLTVGPRCVCGAGTKTFLCSHTGSCTAGEGHCLHGTCHS